MVDNLWDMQLTLLMMYWDELNSNKIIVQYSRNRKKFYKTLSKVNRRIRDRRIPRMSLQDPHESSWRRLYMSNNESAMITLTGLDMATFQWLNSLFHPMFQMYSPFVGEDGKIRIKQIGKGRPRFIDSKDCLGLILAWSRLRGSTISLQMIFGMTATNVSVYLRFGRRLVIRILHKHPEAKLGIPSDEKIKQYQEAIGSRHKNLKNVWCTMDGLKLLLEQAPDCVIQNNFYNGWTHDHYVTSVFVFCPDGTIPIETYNVPGCIHDSMIADWGEIYEKMSTVYERTGGQVTVDSAFCRANNEFLIKSSQANLDDDDPNAFVVNIEATAMRQSAEWGMRALKASFPRLKDRFIYEEYGERRLYFKFLLLIYNVRARRVGINQIQNTYMPHLEKDVNKEFGIPLY